MEKRIVSWPAAKDMRAALRALFEAHCNDATPAQILAVAERFDVEVHALEGWYLEAIDALADA